MFQPELMLPPLEPLQNENFTSSPSAHSPNEYSKLGKGWKLCLQCKERIGARSATCLRCGHVYQFKGKPRYKQNLLDQILLEKNPHLLNTNKNDGKSGYTFGQNTNFMKETNEYTDIRPRSKDSTGHGTSIDAIDKYIEESELLMQCAFDNINLGDLSSASKILKRTHDNILFLGTLVDIFNNTKNHEKKGLQNEL
ncbi:hypothetical protein RFI_28073 [Reticulomyxa filosa]|uniref:Uncharacterized protein n=1 Tax=Reticulomyxa filosa TaxID=46433 RepID=X6M8G4_RETFI|nr:hypothetical protein RFI_28073 [Reticulomyxa filosa]|eukprot:ETO09315.1 hypothetical protein RFI_28073 [Reticulomyxa filosa]